MKNKIINLEDNEGVIYTIEILDIIVHNKVHYAIGINSITSSSIILKMQNSDDGIIYNMLLDKEEGVTKQILEIFSNRSKKGLSNKNLTHSRKITRYFKF